MSFLNDNFISEFLVTVFKWIFEFIGDYSIVILITTIAIRLVLMPLDLKQRKNMRMMANLGPEIESVKKRYANNQEQMNKKVQELYRKHKVKPTAGCLPMLLQMVFLFAFFGSLRVIAAEQTLGLVLNAAEHGAANVEIPAWLWVHNLWQPDSGLAPVMPTSADFLSFLQTNYNYITPQALSMLSQHGIIDFSGATLSVNAEAYNALTNGMVAANGLEGFNNGWFGLPVLAGLAMFFQQWLQQRRNPQQNAAMGGQGKFMMYFFPLFFIYICATSNAAFSVYMVISNLWAMLINFAVDFYYKAKEKKNPVIVR